MPGPFEDSHSTVTQEQIAQVADDRTNPRDLRLLLHMLGTKMRSLTAKLNSAATLQAGFGSGQIPSLDGEGRLADSVLPRATYARVGVVKTARPLPQSHGVLTSENYAAIFGAYGYREISAQVTPATLPIGVSSAVLAQAKGWPMDGQAICSYVKMFGGGMITVLYAGATPLIFTTRYIGTVNAHPDWHLTYGSCLIWLGSWTRERQEVPLPFQRVTNLKARVVMKFRRNWAGYNKDDFVQFPTSHGGFPAVAFSQNTLIVMGGKVRSTVPHAQNPELSSTTARYVLSCGVIISGM